MSPTATAPTAAALAGEDWPAWSGWLLALAGLAMALGCSWLVFEAQAVAPQVTPAAVMPAALTAQSPAGVAVPAAAGSAAGEPGPAVLPPPAAATGVPADCPVPLEIHFAFGGAKVTDPDILPKLGPLAGWVLQHPDAKVLVEGHADALGSDQFNLVLSFKRANAVADVLHQAGLAASQAMVVAAGNHDLVDGAPGSAGVNRRVLLQLRTREPCPTW